MTQSFGRDTVIKTDVSFGTHDELAREGKQGRLLQQTVGL